MRRLVARSAARRPPPWTPTVTLILASRPERLFLQLARPRRDEARGHRLDRATAPDPEPCSCRSGATATWCAALEEGDPEAVYHLRRGGRRAAHAGGPWALLGMQGEHAVFAVDISTADDPVPLLPESARKIRRSALRRLGRAAAGGGGAGACARPDALARAAPFCGVCGGVCDVASAGHMMVCTACEVQHFPRTDPAVIMLVTRGTAPCSAFAALPARQHVFHAGRLRRAGRDAGGGGAPRGARGSRHRRSATCTTTPASPGRSPATSCWASTARA